MRERYRLGVITNDIFTRDDMEFLVRSQALPDDRIIGVQTGGCPHTAIREDASMCRRHGRPRNIATSAHPPSSGGTRVWISSSTATAGPFWLRRMPSHHSAWGDALPRATART